MVLRYEIKKIWEMIKSGHFEQIEQNRSTGRTCSSFSWTPDTRGIGVEWLSRRMAWGSPWALCCLDHELNAVSSRPFSSQPLSTLSSGVSESFLPPSVGSHKSVPHALHSVKPSVLLLGSVMCIGTDGWARGWCRWTHRWGDQALPCSCGSAPPTSSWGLTGCWAPGSLPKSRADSVSHQGPAPIWAGLEGYQGGGPGVQTEVETKDLEPGEHVWLRAEGVSGRRAEGQEGSRSRGACGRGLLGALGEAFSLAACG